MIKAGRRFKAQEREREREKVKLISKKLEEKEEVFRRKN